MNIRKALESLKMKEHYSCDDEFFSCPAHPGYCGHSSYRKCTCGVSEQNEKIDSLIAQLDDEKSQSLIEELED